MATWDHYFHFPAGTHFTIDGPALYNGKGSVIENSGNRLVLRMDLEAYGPAPAVHTVITLEYRQEGAGNLAIVEKDGEPLQRDDDVAMFSDDEKRERKIVSDTVTCSVRIDGKNEIDFDIQLRGQSFDFDFKRQ